MKLKKQPVIFSLPLYNLLYILSWVYSSDFLWLHKSQPMLSIGGLEFEKISMRGINLLGEFKGIQIDETATATA